MWRICCSQPYPRPSTWLVRIKWALMGFPDSNTLQRTLPAKSSIPVRPRRWASVALGTGSLLVEAKNADLIEFLTPASKLIRRHDGDILSGRYTSYHRTISSFLIQGSMICRTVLVSEMILSSSASDLTTVNLSPDAHSTYCQSLQANLLTPGRQ